MRMYSHGCDVTIFAVRARCTRNYIIKKMFSMGVARIFQRGGHRGYSPDHHPGIADYIWFMPLLSLVYQPAQ